MPMRKRNDRGASAVAAAAGGRIREVPSREEVATAEAAVRAIGARYPERVRADVAAMEKALADARSDAAGGRAHLRRVFEICHNVKGQGASFGYALVTRIGQSLCDFLREGRHATDANLEVVRAHLAALATVADNGIAGGGGDVGRRLVERLEAMCAETAAGDEDGPRSA